MDVRVYMKEFEDRLVKIHDMMGDLAEEALDIYANASKEDREFMDTEYVRIGEEVRAKYSERVETKIQASVLD